MSAARGESESRQIILTAGGKALEGATVKSTSLKSEEGSTLDIEIRLTGYVMIKLPTPDGFDKPGEYPDPLYPLKEFRIDPGTSQSLWVTAKVPQDVAHGVYRGTITVSFANASSVDIPVTVKVFKTVLPRQSKLLTAFHYTPWTISKPEYYGETWTGSKLEEDFFKQMIDYRMTPTNTDTINLFPSLQSVLTKSADGKWQADWTDFDAEVKKRFSQGWNYVQLTYFPIGYMQKGEDGSLQEPRFKNDRSFTKDDQAQILRLLNDHLVKRGWTRHFGITAFDEPGMDPVTVERIENLAKFIHENAPDMRLQMVTTDCRERELAKDHPFYTWIPHLPSLHLNPGYEDFLKERQKIGDQAWFYICETRGLVKEGHPYADVGAIDRTGTSQRAFGLMLWKNRLDGFLFWAVNEWGYRGGVYNVENISQGDGVLFYPDETRSNIPHPSLRAALLRDGFEDYDLLAMLDERVEALKKVDTLNASQQSAVKNAQELLDVSEIIPNLRDFSRDIGPYEDLHTRTLESLDALQEIEASLKR